MPCRAKALRYASRLRRMVLQERPACAPSRTRNSKSTRSSGMGRPHSSSWYRIIAGSEPAHPQRVMTRSLPPGSPCQTIARCCEPALGRLRGAVIARSSFPLRAWHACADPGVQRLRQLLLRERWSRAAGAGGPGPEYERIHLHVLDDLLPAATAPVPGRVLHLLADLLLGPAFPQHGQGCQFPGRYAGHKAVGRVRRLVACLAGLCGRAVAVLAADDQRLMKNFGVRLPWRLILMAIDASRMHDDARDRVEERRIGGWGRFAATAGGDRQEDDERQKDAHGPSPQAKRSWRSSGSFRTRLPVAAKTALASAGAVTAVPGSPMPPGGSPFRTRCTSIAGVSLIRSTRTLLKFDCSTRPFWSVASPYKAPPIPNTMPPSICAFTVSGFTTVPQSTAQTIRCTRTSPDFDTATSATCAR